MDTNEPFHSADRDQDHLSDKDNSKRNRKDSDDLDSKVNTEFDQTSKPESKTIQESYKTDPNKVDDKPGFERSAT